MDLKGSLVDTNLRIYPSEKLQNFISTLSPGHNIPENLFKFIKADSKAKCNTNGHVPKPTVAQLTNKDYENLNKIKSIIDAQSPEKNEVEPPESQTNGEADADVPTDFDKDANIEDNEKIEKPYLTTADVEWLYNYLQEKRTGGQKDIPHLHVLLENAVVELPENKVIKRNPILEARCVKLRAQQEARDYRKMTKSVDNVRMKYPEDNISYQLKQVNRQLIAIGQFIISIFAGFLFGFRGIEWMIGPLDFGFRLLLGVMCALVIALAEIYFLAKQLNMELNMPETTQLGGPVKFADDDQFDGPIPREAKQHKD